MVLNYITYDPWWDTDVTILPELCKKYKVNVFVMDTSEHPKYTNKENYGFNKFIIYKPKYRLSDIRRIKDTVKYFKQIYKECCKKDAINLYILGYDVFLSILFYLFVGKRYTLIASHDYREHVDNRRSLKAYINKLTYRGFSHFLFFSSIQKEDFQKDYPDKDVYNMTMPLKDFGAPSRKDSDEKIRFLFFGGLRPYKHPEIFIKAANTVTSGNAMFIIAGCYIKGEGYESLIERNENFRVELRNIDNSEIPDFFYNSDFLVLPYEDVTQSGPSLIAINYGIPIIATRLTAFEKLIKDGENGYLFDVGDVDGLANIFRNIIEKGRDNVERMKANMRKRKEAYIKDTNTIAVFDKIFNNIVIDKE